MSAEFEQQTTGEIWQEVIRDIEHKIICGEYKPGERLPSIRDLTGQYHMSITSIQKAIGKLTKDGVIMTKRGRGYFVKPYTQNDLKAKHKIRLQRTIMEALQYGAEIGLTEEELLAPYRKHSGQ